MPARRARWRIAGLSGEELERLRREGDLQKVWRRLSLVILWRRFVRAKEEEIVNFERPDPRRGFETEIGGDGVVCGEEFEIGACVADCEVGGEIAGRGQRSR